MTRYEKPQSSSADVDTLATPDKRVAAELAAFHGRQYLDALNAEGILKDDPLRDTIVLELLEALGDKLEELDGDVSNVFAFLEVLLPGILKRMEEIHYRATHDGLCDALNVDGFKEALENLKDPQAVIMIDFTNFKAVNDNINHDRGNEAIVGVYKFLKSQTRENDIIARVGGDEFVIILCDRTASLDEEDGEERHSITMGPSELLRITTGRLSEATERFLKANSDLQELNFNVAIGGVEWHDGLDADELIQQAEGSMKNAKAEQHIQGRYRIS